jgi:hypothetical protein
MMVATPQLGTLNTRSYNVAENGIHVRFSMNNSNFAVNVTNSGPYRVLLVRRIEPAGGIEDNMYLAVGESVTIAVGGYLIFQTDAGQTSVVTMTAAYLGP